MSMETMEYAERWRAMVLSAESPQALEYIERTCDRKGHITPELAALIEKRYAQIEEERRGQPF